VRDEHTIAVPLLMGQPSLLESQAKLSAAALKTSEAQVAETFAEIEALAEQVRVRVRVRA